MLFITEDDTFTDGSLAIFVDFTTMDGDPRADH